MLVYIMFVVGFFLLIKGADFLVTGIASLAKKLRMSNLLIGLTLLALGTSLPELVINIIAATNGASDIAFGNIIGSNMSNTLLILGILALIIRLKINKNTVIKEIPFGLLAVLVLLVLVNDKILDNAIPFLSRMDGLILLLFFSIFLYYIYLLAKGSRIKVEEEEVDVKTHKGSTIATFIIIGMLGVFVGGKVIVDGAIAIAQTIGISEFVISLTIVAIGTSLPELATSIMAAKKHDVNMAVGNIIGSNIYNIFLVLGLSAFISPLAITRSLNFDIGFLLAATVLLYIFMFTGKKHELNKGEGITFLTLYLIYIVLIVIRN